MRHILTQYVRDVVRPKHGTPSITLDRTSEPADGGLAWALVQNTAPFTYFGDRPINPNPLASFDTGLDVLALKVLHLPSSARTIKQVLSANPNPHGKQVIRLHDLPSFTLRAAGPTALQVDGDYLGEYDALEFASVPNALRVVC
jgi:diacylglycerol kinase family enzyme